MVEDSAHPPFLRLYMVRHGVVAKQSGHLPAYDAPLIAEQPALEALKAHITTDAEWHVSPLLRARQSYDFLSDGRATPRIDARLEEQNFGDWHEQSLANVWQEIAAKMAPSHPVSFINHDSCPPHGTSFEEVFEQTKSFLDMMLTARPTAPQIIVSHAGTTKALLGHMMGLSAPQALMLTIDPGSISCADFIYDKQRAPAKTQETKMPETKPQTKVRPWQIQYINRLYS